MTRTSRLTSIVAAFALALLAPQLAVADHTPLPQTVTLVGSLQSELGCPGDWQPECAATQLKPVAGQNGVYEGTFTVPAGSYEYKVALNGSWAENYGSGGAAGGANIPLTSPGAQVTFRYDHATHRITDNLPKSVTAERSAQWVSRGHLAWHLPTDITGWTFALFNAPDGGLTSADGAITGGTSLALTLDAAGLTASEKTRFPQLGDHRALRLTATPTRAQLEQLLTGQLAVAAYDASGALVQATGVQIAGVLDDLYAAAAADADLGPTWRGNRPTLRVWAPTAKSVTVLLDTGRGEQRIAMTRGSDGVWSARGHRHWAGARYLYEVTVYAPSTEKVEVNRVTDPYSVALTANSTRSVLIDLDDPALAPKGWQHLRKPVVATPERSTIYELHVRDFSIGDRTVPAAERGTYLAFARAASDGMRHLRALARAGLTTVHLLPVNDIASIEEVRAKQQTPACDLASFGPASEQQQACIAPVRDADGFNWGYDPLHYTTPEGSYATDPEGAPRTVQFRQMVAGLNGAGLQVVMDVVYNHTPASGQDAKSVLDRIVPGYYHRLSATGAVETSTCCSNTATEHVMMEKLMSDSIVTWATEYKVDGFRFDLMGHQPKAAMQRLRARLDGLTRAHDGVDGRGILLYGEGWNFGEVANNARFVQASQLEMAGTGIGTFNDRLRDAVRGGGPFDDDPRVQGFASGLFTDPNGAAVNGSTDQQKARLLLNQDQIKVGLTGNLRDYRFVDRNGATVTGADVDYNGSPTGYTLDPQEAVTYVEAHDNETLFDALTYKLPQATSMADRVRMQTLALSTTAFGQGISFWHAGGELLRSKSLDRNSYNSGDWFNVLDFTHRTNGFARGLPPSSDNESKWPYMRPLLTDAALAPTSADIASAQEQAMTLLRIRQSSPLFRLGSAELVQQKLSFPGGGPSQTPGVIVMHIDDTVGRDVDPALKGLVVVWNATPVATSQAVPAATGGRFVLHPAQAAGSDSVVKRASFDAASGTFTVPPRTVAVFVQR